MKLKEIQQIFHTELGQLFEKEEIDSFFYLLLEEYTGFKSFTLALTPDLIANKAQEGLFFAALSELKLEKPVQQILGKTFFDEMELSVNEHVLIPRSETEGLVKWIKHTFLGEQKEQPLRILDIGTGSGCIAISLAKYFVNAKIEAIDISEEALKIAKKNADKHEVAIEFIETDIFTLDKLPDTYDIIVSNPPYVKNTEKGQMKNNVLQYEPHLALFVEDDDPLLFYKKITALAVDNLVKGGMLFFEINQYLSDIMMALLKDHNFINPELQKDIYNNFRMIKAIKS